MPTSGFALIAWSTSADAGACRHRGTLPHGASGDGSSAGLLSIELDTPSTTVGGVGDPQEPRGGTRRFKKLSRGSWKDKRPLRQSRRNVQ